MRARSPSPLSTVAASLLACLALLCARVSSAQPLDERPPASDLGGESAAQDEDQDAFEAAGDGGPASEGDQEQDAQRDDAAPYGSAEQDARKASGVSRLGKQAQTDDPGGAADTTAGESDQGATPASVQDAMETPEPGSSDVAGAEGEPPREEATGAADRERDSRVGRRLPREADAAAEETKVEEQDDGEEEGRRQRRWRRWRRERDRGRERTPEDHDDELDHE